jgi:hypothetical protein
MADERGIFGEGRGGFFCHVATKGRRNAGAMRAKILPPHSACVKTSR